MKIRVVLVDGDSIYTERFDNVIREKYADKIELNICSSAESFQKFIENNIVHIVLVDEQIDADRVDVPGKAEKILMVHTPNIVEKEGFKAICKFQRIDLIYKELLGIMSEHDFNSGIVSKEDGKCSVVVFTAPAGGVGTSSAAVAFAINKARKGNKVFYLNLESTGVADQYFTGSGNTTFSDVLFNVKNKKANLTMKIESDIRSSLQNVSFFASSKNAYDLAEMSPEDFDVIMRELVRVRDYDYLVVDVDFAVNLIFERLVCNDSRAVVLVDDGGNTANYKTLRGLEILEIFEKKNAIPLLNKVFLMYNRFSASKSSRLGNLRVQELGGCRRYEMSDEMQVIEEISKSDVFDKL